MLEPRFDGAHVSPRFLGGFLFGVGVAFFAMGCETSETSPAPGDIGAPKVVTHLEADLGSSPSSGCVTSGGACAQASDCCNGNPCVLNGNGQLACSSSSCQSAGQACTTNADCGTGLSCFALPGSIGGICAPGSPSSPTSGTSPDAENPLDGSGADGGS